MSSLASSSNERRATKGIAAGWIMALTAGAFSIVATGSTFTFCVLRWKGDRSYETM